MKAFLVVYASVLWIVLIIAEDYCRIECQGLHHIGCQNTGNFNKNCEDGAEIIFISEELKEIFITLHNDLRNVIASGFVLDFKPAKRMGSVSWDDELAILAELNVKKCDMKHDQCRNTKKYKQAGQNIAQLVGYGPNLTPQEAITIAFKQWRNNYKNVDMSIIDEFHDNSKKIEEFTILVNEKNSKIGCALLFTPYENVEAYVITCNYASDNIYNEPVYESGQPTSNCKTGINLLYHSLCSTSEKYDV